MVRQRIPYGAIRGQHARKLAYRSPVKQHILRPSTLKRNRKHRTTYSAPDQSYVSDSLFDDLTNQRWQVDDGSDGYDDYNEIDDVDDVDDLFEWEEETTLVAALLKEESSDDMLASLVNELKGPLSAQSQHLRKHFAEVFVPAVNLVREAHARIDGIDGAFGKGILTFDQSCKMMERVMVNGRNALVGAYMKLQQNEQRLLAELAEAYARRDQLWVDLEHAINKSADPALSKIKEVPTSIERMISAVERQSKELDKETADSAKADKLIRELFERLA